LNLRRRREEKKKESKAKQLGKWKQNLHISRPTVKHNNVMKIIISK
jgi:hypothetical protein